MTKTKKSIAVRGTLTPPRENSEKSGAIAMKEANHLTVEIDEYVSEER